MNQQYLSAFIWSVADLRRGDYEQSDYGEVVLPFTVLRRLDCVLEPTKAAVLAGDFVLANGPDVAQSVGRGRGRRAR
jgi:type I restriction-modification system DNA methylase subunit